VHLARGHCARGAARRWTRGCEVLGGAPVERGGGVEQYLIGGEGVGRWGDNEVAERAQPGSVGVATVAGSDGEGSL
jgi:hypothetical protein